MRITAQVQGSVPEVLQRKVLRAEARVTAAVAGATQVAKQAFRDQVAGALGRRLGNSIRSAVYPEGTASLNAAGLVWARAPQIVGAHARGAVIRARGSRFLAVPLPAAGAGRPTPAEWQFKTGRKLAYVPTAGRRRNALLVAEGVRLGGRGVAVAAKRKRRRDGIQTGETGVPVFVLVPQVRLKKVLDIPAVAATGGAALRARLRGLVQG